ARLRAIGGLELMLVLGVCTVLVIILAALVIIGAALYYTIRNLSVKLKLYENPAHWAGFSYYLRPPLLRFLIFLIKKGSAMYMILLISRPIVNSSRFGFVYLYPNLEGLQPPGSLKESRKLFSRQVDTYEKVPELAEACGYFIESHFIDQFLELDHVI